jgi:hypothetical protein
MGYDPRYSDPTGRTYFYVVLTSSKRLFCKHDSSTVFAEQILILSQTVIFKNCLSTVSGVTMGMTFTDIENKSAKRLIGIAAVIFLHLLVAYILMSGLANNIQKPAEKPVELQIIQILSRLLHQSRKSRNQRKNHLSHQKW